MRADVTFPMLDDEQEENGKKKDARETPKIVEETLFKKRQVLITGQITDVVARLTTERLLALSSDGDWSTPLQAFMTGRCTPKKAAK